MLACWVSQVSTEREGKEQRIKDQHAEIVRILARGKIIHSRPNDLHESAFGHESFLVRRQHTPPLVPLHAVHTP